MNVLNLVCFFVHYLHDSCDSNQHQTLPYLKQMTEIMTAKRQLTAQKAKTASVDSSRRSGWSCTVRLMLTRRSAGGSGAERKWQSWSLLRAANTINTPPGNCRRLMTNAAELRRDSKRVPSPQTRLSSSSSRLPYSQFSAGLNEKKRLNRVKKKNANNGS